MDNLFVLIAAMGLIQTDAPLREHAPVFSPDGHRIAYYSYRNGLPDIFVYDRTTGSNRQITDTPELWEIEPYWSRDGMQLIFPAGISMRRLSMRSQRLDSLAADRLPLAMRITGPTGLSADGNAVYFFQSSEAGDRLWRAEIGGVARLVSAQLPDGRNVSPHATPDGQSVVFLNTPENGETADIYRLELADRRIYRVTRTPWDEGYLSVTPDSRSVIFSAEIDGRPRDLYQVSFRQDEQSDVPQPLLPFRGNTRFFADRATDGTLVYDEVGDDGGARIWVLGPNDPMPALLPE